MQKYSLKFEFEYLPPIFTRRAQALIAVFDQENKLILAGKNIYPLGIYRLLGGGIELGEDHHLAAKRELEEELAIVIPTTPKLEAVFSSDILTDNIPKDNYKNSKSVYTKVAGQYLFNFKTYLFSYNLQNDNIKPSDDVDKLVRFNKMQLKELIKRYQNLPVNLDKIGGDLFSWADYGKYFARIHAEILRFW